MAWRLAPHCRAAVSGDDLVLLDLRSGDYACVPRGGAVLAPGDGACAFAAADTDLLAALSAEGLVVEGVGHVPAILDPRRSLETEIGRTTLGQRLRLALALVDLLVHFRGRTFTHLIGSMRRRRRHGENQPIERLRAEVGAFLTLLPWVPFQGVCLYRSYLLLRILHRAGLEATWVFGVRTWPFEAHCWLQVGDLVLDDHLDHVSGYAPILAV